MSRSIPLGLFLSALTGAACLSHGTAAAPTTSSSTTRRSEVALASGLSYSDALTVRATKNFLCDFEPRAEDGSIRAVIEIPAGTCEKWEVKDDGVLHWDMKNGVPREVRYLGYPCNYGMVPRTLLSRELGGDGDPADIIVLGPALPRGSVVDVRVIGVLHLLDGGEKDDKLVAIPPTSTLADAHSISELDQRFPGASRILETWFTNYKGPGVMQSGGFGERDEAERFLTQAIDAYAAEH